MGKFRDIDGLRTGLRVAEGAMKKSAYQWAAGLALMALVTQPALAAKPVEQVKVCATYGHGYAYDASSDRCVKAGAPAKAAKCGGGYTRISGTDTCLLDKVAALHADATAAGSASPWNKYYIGAWTGWGWGSGSWSNPIDGDLGRINESGAIAGIYLGKNWMVGNNNVVSLEFNASATDVHGSNVSFGTWYQHYDWRAEEDVRVLYGWLATPNAEFYGAVGALAGQITLRADWRENGNRLSATPTAFGWTIGAGMRWLFAPNWIARAEVDYWAYSNFSANLNSANGFPGYQVDSKNLQYVTVVGGVEYLFDTSK
jgi:opacity protein-like surface antigen